MIVWQAGFLRSIFWTRSPLEAGPFSSGLQTSGVDEEGPLSGLDRYVGGAYRETAASPAGPEGRIPDFSDSRRPLEDRLGSIKRAGRLLQELPENSHEFFDGVMALFDIATHPGATQDAAYQIRLTAAIALAGALTRLPAGEDRLRVLVHASLRFIEAARGDILAEKGWQKALTEAAMRIGHRLEEAKKYCSSLVETSMNEVQKELPICAYRGPEDRFQAPWTWKKGYRNAKIGALVGGFLGLGLSAWGMFFSFFWPAASVFLLTTGAVVTVGSAVGSFFYKAPQRLRRKLLTWALRNDRPSAKELEEKRMRLLKP